MLSPDAQRDEISTTKKLLGGTHRVVAPAETVERARGLSGPVGITRVANLTHLDCIGIPVVTACRPNARSVSVSLGKGVDMDAARASAMMEAIELYHAERIDRPLKLATWNELRFSHRLAELDKLPKTTASRLDANKSILWIEGLDLLSGQGTWVPHELVHMNYRLPLPPSMGCFVMSSNGLASGNHHLEALIHALTEVIERDAVVLHRMLPPEQQDVRRLDLASVSHHECRRLLELYERAGIAVGVWDVTSDVGIATFRCVIQEREPNVFRPIGPLEGLGCHLDRDVALLRALTEAAQSRLALIAGARDDNGRPEYLEAQDPEIIEAARKRLAGNGNHSLEAVPTSQNPTLEADLQIILARLHRVAITQIVAVDLSKEEFHLPVVRVVVPGLEPYHQVRNFVPGRRAQEVWEKAAAGVPTWRPT